MVNPNPVQRGWEPRSRRGPRAGSAARAPSGRAHGEQEPQPSAITGGAGWD